MASWVKPPVRLVVTPPPTSVAPRINTITLGAAVQQGPEIARPPATGSGTFYYATDTHKLFYDDGTGG